MNQNGKTHAILSTARVANIPSVAGNILLGAIPGFLIGNPSSPVPWLVFAPLLLAGICLYVGGNFFNDWMDRDWDRQHRPERALPRGLFSTRLYLLLAVALMGSGIALAACAGLGSAVIAASIVFWIAVYTRWHKRTAWAVIPMGLCRALLPVMGFFAFHPYIDTIWPVGCALLCYIAGLSLSARYESMSAPPLRIAILARALLLATAVWIAWANKSFYLPRVHVVAGALPYLLWTGYCLRFLKKPVPRLVAGLLAGIPLVDAMLLLPLGWTLLTRTGGSGSLILPLACLLAPPLAFISALLLQRLAPAT